MKAPMLLAVLLFEQVLAAEGFVNLPGETNSISVRSNEAILLTCVLADMSRDWPVYQAQSSFNLRWAKGCFFAGPCQITTTSKCVVAYSRFIAPHIRTAIITNDTYRTNLAEPIPPRFVMSVPDGSTLTILPFYDGFISGARPGDTNFHLLYGPPSGEIDGLKQTDPLQFTGPIDLQFVSQPTWAPMTYVLDDSAIELSIEKSSDLKQWVPVTRQRLDSSSTNAFFRVHISK